ncbi:MAG: ligase 1, partial [Solirubrobacteraceae bacterium]|nr:ligase 1 [Solirubrobacteraceae bacterium]
KTFKGLTDELLAWQTEQLQALATRTEKDYIVHVRPELVVEIAFDGVQTSPRYPGGVALRFARVLRYRPDKTAAEADDLAAVALEHARHDRLEAIAQPARLVVESSDVLHLVEQPVH